jgi:hypothetical protein
VLSGAVSISLNSAILLFKGINLFFARALLSRNIYIAVFLGSFTVFGYMPEFIAFQALADL